jgi:3-hydroxyisobutyrate dehydrogenase-like beta-hydroxyacid dehydrogenase
MPGIVGFIGLGAMGDPMALNLVKRGFSMVVHDVDPVKAERWGARGAAHAPSPPHGAAKTDRTIC